MPGDGGAGDAEIGGQRAYGLGILIPAEQAEDFAARGVREGAKNSGLLFWFKGDHGPPPFGRNRLATIIVTRWLRKINGGYVLANYYE